MAARRRRRRRAPSRLISRTTTTDVEAGSAADAGFTTLEIVLGVAVLGGLAYLLLNASGPSTTTTTTTNTSSSTPGALPAAPPASPQGTVTVGPITSEGIPFNTT